jgi:hypothetical protein
MSREHNSYKKLFVGFLNILAVFVIIIGMVINPSGWRATPAVAAPGTTAALPYVAIHISETTQGVTLSQTNWPYFTEYNALQEALRSDGTPFVNVSDANIAAGGLLNPDGSPHYPIVISLASEAVSDAVVTQLRGYVSAGGFMLVGSSAFTLNPDGSARGDIALGAEMGLHMVNAVPTANWTTNTTITKVLADHRLVSHIPAGTLTWYMPHDVNHIPLGLVPQNPTHQVWTVSADVGTEVVARAVDNTIPVITTRPYGSNGGRFIYDGLQQPLLEYGGRGVGMYSYLIVRKAIEWAFEESSTPILKLSPWRYEYDAAYTVRHDFENFVSSIEHIEASACYEHSVGVNGDYYFTTGTLRTGSEDQSPIPFRLTAEEKAAVQQSLRNAVQNCGATIGSHNGGLKTTISTINPGDYDYWHWGPDFILDITHPITITYPTPITYSNGTDYAYNSLLNSFTDIETWLNGLSNGRPGCIVGTNCPRLFSAPGFDAFRDPSYNILQTLHVSTAGEQKLGLFPHWTVSTGTADYRYSTLSLGTYEWYVGTDIAQSLDFIGHTITTTRAAIDFYYNQGGLINLYSHSVSYDTGDLSVTRENGLTQLTLAYTLSKPRLWVANAIAIYDWWSLRSAVSVTPTYTRASTYESISANITGATDPETAIEVLLPNNRRWAIQSNIEVYINASPADPSNYRFTTNGIKVRVGTASTVEIRYNPGTALATPPPNNVCLGTESGSFMMNQTAGWSYRNRIWINNTTGSTLPAGSSIRLSVDTASLISAGRLQADGDDLRIVWDDGFSLKELDRVAETPFNTTNTEIWFKLQANVSTGANDGSYYVYYGNPAASMPPSNPRNVYLFWDSFDRGTTVSPLYWSSVGEISISGGRALLDVGERLNSSIRFDYGSVEMRLALQDVDNFAWWGWGTPFTFNAWNVFQENPASGVHNFVALHSDGTNEGLPGDLADPSGGLTNDHIYRIDRWPGHARWSVDGTAVYTATSNLSAGLMLPYIQAWGLPISVDWVKVRSYPAGSDPVVTQCAMNIAIANAGRDRGVPTGDVVTLNGTGSSDNGHPPLSFQWTQIAGLPVTLSDPTASQPTLTAPSSATILVFSLTVSNSLNYPSFPDTMSIIVSDPTAVGVTNFKASNGTKPMSHLLIGAIITGALLSIWVVRRYRL